MQTLPSRLQFGAASYTRGVSLCLEVTSTVLYTLLTLLSKKEDGEENSVSDLLIIFYNIPGLIYKHFRSIVGQHQEGVWDKITFQLPYSVLKRQLL